MFYSWTVLFAGLAYVGLLFAVASFGDRKARGVESSSSEPSCNPSANQRADVLRRAMAC